MELSQYQIVLINLDPTLGSEIKKTRPCVIISPDEMNRHLNTIIVAPMTTSPNNYPTRIKFKHDNKTSSIALDQVRTIDKQRIVKILGQVGAKEIRKIKAIFKETFVD